MRKKALLTYMYSNKNAGDMAICLGALDILEEANYEVSSISRFDENHPEYKMSVNYLNKYYKNLNVVPGPFKLERYKSKFSVYINYIVGGTRNLALYRSEFWNSLVSKSDVVFLNGGNILRCASFSDFARLIALVFPLKLAIKNNKKFVILPHSTTKINVLGKFILKNIMKEASQVWARENLSYKKFKEAFKEVNLYSNIDMAFFIRDRGKVTEEYMNRYSSLISKGTVGITLRGETLGDLGKLDNNKIEKIVETTEKVVEKLLENKKKVIIFVQTKKDKELSEKLYKKYKKYGVLLIEEYDAFLLREIYKNLDLLIGMRLHSLILAMSTGTRVVGYFEREWGLKNPGIMNKFKMDYSYTEEENLTNKVITSLKCYSREEILSLVQSEKTIFLNKLRAL